MPNDLELKPDFVFEEKPSYNTIITKFENGYEQRRQKWAGAIIEYSLQFKNREASDLSTIRTLFDLKKGALTSFSWTHPTTSVTKTVRFKEDSLAIQNTAYGLFDFAFVLVEVL